MGLHAKATGGFHTSNNILGKVYIVGGFMPKQQEDSLF